MSESTYTGAPDECNIHWPAKLDENGCCQIEGCPYALTTEEAELAHRLQAQTIRDFFKGQKRSPND